eukprot:5099938-Alexandrium_andersonii.AAC.1
MAATPKAQQQSSKWRKVVQDIVYRFDYEARGISASAAKRKHEQGHREQVLAEGRTLLDRARPLPVSYDRVCGRMLHDHFLETCSDGCVYSLPVDCLP